MKRGRWDYLYETRPRPIRDWALGELATELARELGQWPLAQLEWLDESERQRAQPALLRPSAPPRETMRVALELARLELLHEVEKIDAFLRSADARAHLPDALEQSTALFLCRWLVESCLALQEATPGKFKRRDLAGLIERVERLTLGSEAPLRI